LEYDGGGRKLVQHYDPKQGGNGVDKRDEYVFDGLDPVAEYDMLNGQRTDYYRGAGGHIALMHQYKGGTRGQMYWHHYNNKGDVVGLTKQNGNSHHNYRYDPYGAVLPENGNFTDPHNHYTLTGKEFDENTGLVWFGARHYEPETGVWMGQDVYRGRLDSPMSLHRYGYVSNNPINYFDYYGYKLRFAAESSNEFRQQFADAIKYLNSAGVSGPIAELEKLDTIVYIEEISLDEENAYWWSVTNTIYWSPYLSVECTTGGRLTPALIFLHEAVHALGDLTGIAADDTTIIGDPYDNDEERRVIEGYEVPAAQKLGEGIRSDHGGTPIYPTSGSTSSMTETEELLIQAAIDLKSKIFSMFR
jgi:RHS repeat-associated protein